ncbi:sulfotransferase [Planotetraspora sp. A-T 1434]|uniref:sulfotransferase family protein n=1 Tax=Planotetraspora sp. A-T 1434 TaxID=2979219 RepID=UPI0021BEB6C7|nr:sulfotransferase [Planotetraspora sp. A-T 1434]MCT9932762.1 sulfotransferase [Planotetraspora sp. A-T 1434]
MRPPTHILVVNGVKVRQPVFVMGAPHSGADLLGRALKRSPGFHVTMGRAPVARVVYAFARRPSIARSGGAPSVIRDVLAEAWQVVPGACAECTATCREAGGIVGSGPCVGAGTLARFGDAGPDLLYSAPVLLRAFPDARLIQIIRDGRDVVADMLADPTCMAWFKPHMLSEDAEFPNPFLGVSSAGHRGRWNDMAPAGKCALRWRGAVRLSATLRRELPAEQLLTLRYEDMLAAPGEAIDSVSSFLETKISTIALYGTAAPKPGGWRKRLTPADAELVEKVGREELRRLGYR